MKLAAKQPAKSIWAFCLYHYIPLSMVWQFLLIKRLVYHSSVIQYDTEKLLLLLMKRFLPGFVKKISLLLNRQAKYAIKTLNFARAIERMRLSMELHNYTMADICAELLFHGRAGINKNRYEAVEISDAGYMAGNERCACLIRIFSFELNEEHNRKQDSTTYTTQVVVKSPEHFRLESSRTYQQFSSKEYPLQYMHKWLRSPLIIDEWCACIYCTTLKTEIFPKQHRTDCFAFANSGYAPAQCALGNYYQYEDKTPPHYEIAKDWYLKSALQGYPEAIYRIARHMFYGIGSEADFVTKKEILTAYKLFQYAKYAGNEECDELLKFCREKLAQKNRRW
jgi:TPR repeat protein